MQHHTLKDKEHNPNKNKKPEAFVSVFSLHFPWCLGPFVSATSHVFLPHASAWIPRVDYRGRVGEHGRRGGLGAGPRRPLSPGQPSLRATSLCLLLRECAAGRRDGESAANPAVLPEV